MVDHQPSTSRYCASIRSLHCYLLVGVAAPSPRRIRQHALPLFVVREDVTLQYAQHRRTLPFADIVRHEGAVTNPRVLGTLTTGLRPPRVWVLEETAGPESLGHLSPAVWARRRQQSALRWLWGRSRGLNRPLLRVGKERRSLLRGRCRLLLLRGLLVKRLSLSLPLHASAVKSRVTQSLAIVTIRLSAGVTSMARPLTDEAMRGALELVVALQSARVALVAAPSPPASASAAAASGSTLTLLESGLVGPLRGLLLLLCRVGRRCVLLQRFDGACDIAHLGRKGRPQRRCHVRDRRHDIRARLGRRLARRR